MTDKSQERMNESLSALLDGEADELEIRRLLNRMDETELQQQWQRHQMLGALMRDEPMGDLDLTQGINAGIDGIDVLQTTEDKRSAETASAQPWFKSLTSAAIAASVTLAVLIGVRSMDVDSPAGPEVLVEQSGQPAIQTQGAQEQVIQQLVNNSAESEAGISAQDLQKSQQQLQEYVLKQSDNPGLQPDNGVKPFARVVNFADKTETESDK